MKCVSFTLVNCINKLQEVLEDSKKIVLVLKGLVTISFFMYKIPTKIPNKEEILNFCKT